MKTRHTIPLALATLFAVLLIALTIANTLTQRNVDKAIAQIPKPAIIAAYEERLEAAKRTESVEHEAPDSVPGPPAKNADTRTTIERWAALFKKLETLDQDKRWIAVENEFGYDENHFDIPWTDDEWDAAADFFADQSDFIEEIWAVASEGGPVIAVDYGNYISPMSDFSLSRSLARLLGKHAITAAHFQKTDEALDSIVAIFELANAVSAEKRFIPQLVRGAILNIGVSILKDVIGPGTLTATQVHRFVDVLDPSDIAQSYSKANEVDNYLKAHLLRKEMSGGWVNLEDFSPQWRKQSFLEKVAWQVYRSPLGQPTRNAELTSIIQDTRDATSLLARPYYETKVNRETLDRRAEETPFYKPTLRSMSDFNASLTFVPALYEATSNLVRIGLLLELFYVEHQRYPESLFEIANDIDNGNLPIDPFSGEPFRYIPSDSTFLLYSIGRNEVDDGGGYHRFNGTKGDIVWRGEAMNRRKEQDADSTTNR